MSSDELEEKDLEELKEIHSQLQEKINNQLEEMQEA